MRKTFPLHSKVVYHDQDRGKTYLGRVLAIFECGTHVIGFKSSDPQPATWNPNSRKTLSPAQYITYDTNYLIKEIVPAWAFADERCMYVNPNKLREVDDLFNLIAEINKELK